MKREQDIEKLLRGNRSGPDSFRIPEALRDKIMQAGRKKFGPLPDRNLKPLAFFYFAAQGVLDWEESSK